MPSPRRTPALPHRAAHPPRPATPLSHRTAPSPRRTASLLLAAALAVPVTGCGLIGGAGSEGSADPEPGAGQGPGGSEPAPSPIELAPTVENPPWRAEALEGPQGPGIHQISVFTAEDGAEVQQVALVFRGAEQTGDGLLFDVEFLWHVAEPDGVVLHDQVYVESGGDRYTTGEEGELSSLAAHGEEFSARTEVLFPDAPDTGAFFFQGPGYEADGSGLPPIGVCYEAGGGFGLGPCA